MQVPGATGHSIGIYSRAYLLKLRDERGRSALR